MNKYIITTIYFKTHIQFNSYYKKKFLKYFFNVDMIKDYNQLTGEHRTHTSWKKSKKEKTMDVIYKGM